MTVKTITVTEAAYECIKRLKSEKESFSDLFLRLGSTEITAKDVRGILKLSPEEVEEFRKRVRQVHERVGEGFHKRIKDVRARFERLNRAHT